MNVKQKKYLFYSITDGSPGSAMFENKAVFLFYFNLYPTDSDEMKKLVTSVKLVGKISVFKAN